MGTRVQRIQAKFCSQVNSFGSFWRIKQRFLYIVYKKIYFRHRTKSNEYAWKNEDVLSSTNFVLTHLQPDTEYEFVIEPFNELGKGFPSEIVTAKTKSETSYQSFMNLRKCRKQVLRL